MRKVPPPDLRTTAIAAKYISPQHGYNFKYIFNSFIFKVYYNIIITDYSPTNGYKLMLGGNHATIGGKHAGMGGNML